MPRATRQIANDEWVAFGGGELEGRRSSVLCAECRKRPCRAPDTTVDGRAQALCFHCYRAGVEREKALKSAGQLDTASEARFQFALPFEPVDTARLAMLRAERVAATSEDHAGGRFEHRRRAAQMAARRALQAIADGLKLRRAAFPEQERVMGAAIHAAELQLPEDWLPFVASW